MATTMLVRREKSDPELDAAFEQSSLAEEARQLLGISSLADYLRLGQALDKIDCRPFTAKSVTGYMKSKERASKSLSPSKENICVAWAAISGLAAIGSLALLAIFTLSSDPVSPWFVTWQIPGLCCFSMFLSFCVGDGFGKQRESRGWRTYGLNEYSAHHAIPAYALQTAVDLKKEMPDASLSVVALESNFYKLCHDPFLVATAGNQSFYIEVWNEPGYLQQREI